MVVNFKALIPIYCFHAEIASIYGITEGNEVVLVNILAHSFEFCGSTNIWIYSDGDLE